MKKVIFLSFLLICLLSGVKTLYAQPGIVQGTITDANSGETLIGVNIVEVDRNGRFINGAISDVNGNYVLRVTDISNEIQVSFIGYTKQSFHIQGRNRVDIRLEFELTTIGEVVVTGDRLGHDGFTSIRDRATAVQRVEFTELRSVMSTTVEGMLQGRLSNVDISSFSGDPGSGLNIRIRGTASLNARNQPLIVINGIPYDARIDENFDFGAADVERFGALIDVSPEDIESIEVLRDAASTAIWGSRASNGVIMIQTKRGLRSKPQFDYSVRASSSFEPPPIPMLDGAGYSRLIAEAFFNVDRNEFFNTNPQAMQIAFDPDWEEYHNFSQNTNWVDEITQVAMTMEHNFSVRGGGEKARYNLSMGYVDEGGTTIGNNLKKLNLRASLDYDLSTRLQLISDVMFTRYDQNNTYDVEDWEFTRYNKTLRAVAYRRMPNLSIFDRDTLGNHFGEYFTPMSTLQGSARDFYNPVAFAKLGSQNRLRDNSRALLSLRYLVAPGVIFNSTVTMDVFDNNISKFLPQKALGYQSNSDLSNRAVNEFSKRNSIYTINQIIYRPQLNPDHELVFMSQFDTESTSSRWYQTASSQSASPSLRDPVNDKRLTWFGASFSQFRSMGLFTTGHYKYKDRYSIMLGAKYEGNSRFSRESRWGLFPSVSAFWRISNEEFMSNFLWIDDLRFRVSWGQTGNSPDQNYLYFNTYRAGANLSYMDMQGVMPTGVQLTSLQWEIIDQINPGISFNGFNGRMNIEIDYYRKKTMNLYLRESGIPEHTGFRYINLNDGEMENSGWEFLMDYTVIRQRDFSLNFNMNISTNRNRVIRLPDNYSLVFGNMLENGNYKISVVPGQPIGGFFGYQFLGVYPSDEQAVVLDRNGNPVYGFNQDAPMVMIMGGPSGYVFEGGDAMYKDQNHDGKIDELDLIYLGDLNPKFMGGFGPRVQYKGLTLNTFFVFKVGQKIINQTRIDTENMYSLDNQSLATNWRWRRAGDITNMPRAVYNTGFNWLGSDRFVEDGSYVRLRSASISYDFSKETANRLRVSNFRLFFTAHNLFTITNYSGQDPDVAPPSRPDELPKDFSRTPPSRRFTLGINVGF